MTDFITDKSVEMIDRFSKADRPFFLYVAHTAPHWPLHAPEADVASYRGMYDDGWEALRHSRYQRQLAAGLFDGETTPLPARKVDRLAALWTAWWERMQQASRDHRRR